MNMKTLMYRWRETLVYAYLIGLYETLRWGPGAGRTHANNHAWSDAYDTGMKHADWLCGRPLP